MQNTLRGLAHTRNTRNVFHIKLAAKPTHTHKKTNKQTKLILLSIISQRLNVWGVLGAVYALLGVTQSVRSMFALVEAFHGFAQVETSQTFNGRRKLAKHLGYCASKHCGSAFSALATLAATSADKHHLVRLGQRSSNGLGNLG